MATLASPIALELLRMLRCPRCGAAISTGDDPAALRCASGHAYPVHDGVPRLLDGADGAMSALTQATSAVFGRQWTELGEDAHVDRSDLLLHLPSSLGEDIFRGVVLDVGCGMGRYAALVARTAQRVVGMDLSVAVDEGRRRHPGVHFVQADIARAPFAPAAFDTVYSFGVLHHLDDPISGFRRCFELVAPGGTLLVWVYSEHGGLLRRGRRATRALVRRRPRLLQPIAWAAAVSLWALWVAPRRAAGRDAGKLAFYHGKGLRQLHVDCHDALAAPAEIYLSASDCASWLASIDAARGGCERRRDGSGWIIWATRAPHQVGVRG